MKLSATASCIMSDGTEYRFTLAMDFPMQVNSEQAELTARTLIDLVSAKVEESTDIDVDDDGDPLIPAE